MWGAFRELRLLPTYLLQDEVVEDLVACSFGKTGGRAVAVATNERLLFVKDGWIFKNSENLAYSDVKSVEINTHLFFADVTFVGEGHEIEVKKVGRFAAKHMVDLVRARVGVRYNKWQRDEQARVDLSTGAIPVVNPLAFTVPATAPTTPPNPLAVPSAAPQTPFHASAASQDSFLSRMERLTQLRDSGALTEMEFQSKKRDLLKEF